MLARPENHPGDADDVIEGNEPFETTILRGAAIVAEDEDVPGRNRLRLEVPQHLIREEFAFEESVLLGERLVIQKKLFVANLNFIAR